MNHQEQFVILGCVYKKYEDQVGKEEALAFFARLEDPNDKEYGNDKRMAVPIMIEDKGVSCTRTEMEQHWEENQ